MGEVKRRFSDLCKIWTRVRRLLTRTTNDYKTDGRPPLTRPWCNVRGSLDVLGLRKGSNVMEVDAESVWTGTSELHWWKKWIKAGNGSGHIADELRRDGNYRPDRCRTDWLYWRSISTKTDPWMAKQTRSWAVHGHAAQMEGGRCAHKDHLLTEGRRTDAMRWDIGAEPEQPNNSGLGGLDYKGCRLHKWKCSTRRLKKIKKIKQKEENSRRNEGAAQRGGHTRKVVWHKTRHRYGRSTRIQPAPYKVGICTDCKKNTITDAEPRPQQPERTSSGSSQNWHPAPAAACRITTVFARCE